MDAHTLNTLVVIGTLLSAVSAATAALLSLRQVKKLDQTWRVHDRDSRVSVLLQVADRWTDVLPVRYQFRKRREEYKNVPKLHDDVADFLPSDEWKELRKLCNFYEFIGLLAYYEILSIETILVLVTVDPEDHEYAKPTLDWLRREYRPDIYLFWDWLVSHCEGRAAVNPFGRNSNLSL